MNDAIPCCIQCGYNLTALESPRCPECGWLIDWQLARMDEEGQRPGTPVHRARSWRRWPAILSTLGLMLFRPIRFARVLRYDEPLWPAVVVAVAAYLITFVPMTLKDSLNLEDAATGNASYLSAILSCIACNVLVIFPFLRPRSRKPPTWQRLRLLLLLSFYATCFVATWDLVAQPPTLTDWESADFFWPLQSGLYDQARRLITDSGFLGRTIICYWWFAVLFVFAAVRCRPRWAAVVLLFVVPLSSWLNGFVGMSVYRAIRPEWP